MNKECCNFVGWVWIGNQDTGLFCGGIYANDSETLFRTTLSDLAGISFKTAKEASQWLRDEKLGRNVLKAKAEKAELIRKKIPILEAKLKRIEKCLM